MLFSSISYLFIIVTPHYLIESPDSLLHRVPLKYLSKGDVQLAQLMSTAKDNLPVLPLLLGLMKSTNDSNIFVFKEKANNSDKWYLVSEKNIGKNLVNNQYIKTALVVLIS